MAKPLKFHQTLNQAPKGPKHGKHRRAGSTAHGNSIGEPSDSTGGSDQSGTTWTPVNFSTFRAFSAWSAWDLAAPEPAHPSVPYAGIRTGEIIGHRLWWVIDGYLGSLAHRRLWMPREVLSGNLTEVVDGGGWRRPIWGGVYAFGKREQLAPEIREHQNDIADIQRSLARGASWTPFCWHPLQETQTFVSGTIKMWGDVVEHEHGYRAEFAKLNSIDEMFGPGNLDALREKYGLALNIQQRQKP